MVAGLLRPYEYSNEFSAGAGPSSETTSGSGDRKGKGKSRALWELPDTSILFRSYLDSGRMINVFDWFESFKGVLEAQRKSGLVQGRAAGGNDGDDDDGEVEMPQSPRKKEKEKKSKGKGKETEVMMGEDEDGEDWKLEVQARFIRALHELDYLGFIKHTGRKRDHVLRTLFEVGDDDEEEGNDD
jgi:origin recognition complex subunit 3